MMYAPKKIPTPNPAIKKNMIAQLRESVMLDHTAVISFHHGGIRRLKELEPRLAVGVLEGARPIDPVAILRSANADIYAPHYGAMDPELVEQVHTAGGVVGAWTVDDAAAVAWCQVSKPDSIFTNRPREILAAVRQGR